MLGPLVVAIVKALNSLTPCSFSAAARIDESMPPLRKMARRGVDAVMRATDLPISSRTWGNQ